MDAGAWGKHPTKRPLDAEFLESDVLLKQYSGQDLGIVLCVVELRADLPAWCFASGLRTWQHNEHPCSLCKITKDEMLTIEGILNEHELNGENDYDDLVNFHRIVLWLVYKLHLHAHRLHIIVSLQSRVLPASKCTCAGCSYRV